MLVEAKKCTQSTTNHHEACVGSSIHSLRRSDVLCRSIRTQEEYDGISYTMEDFTCDGQGTHLSWQWTAGPLIAAPLSYMLMSTMVKLSQELLVNDPTRLDVARACSTSPSATSELAHIYPTRHPHLISAAARWVLRTSHEVIAPSLDDATKSNMLPT